MDLEVTNELVYWRGPSPWYFVATPRHITAAIAAVAREATYGWGCIPVRARIGDTSWTTSLFPKDGGYLVPVKANVRRAEGVELGDTVTVRIALDV
jgi:hypothetical protein